MTAEDDAFPERIRASPLWLLTYTTGHAQRLGWAAMAAHGARRYHYVLLAALEEFGPASQAALGRRVEIDRSDVVAAINELAELNYVERTLDASDRRRNTITITEDGRRQLQRLDEMLLGLHDELLAPLSTEERTELVRLLSRVLDHHRM